MICKIIEKISLYIFWRCLDENTRNESIKAHRYSKINIDIVNEKVEIIEKVKNDTNCLKDEIKIINRMLSKNELSFEDLKMKLINLEKDFERI